MRVAFVTTHPIQYQVPWLRLLSATSGIDLKVYFAMLPTPAQQGADFGIDFRWDVGLLDGYEYEVLSNRARIPSAVEFLGCDTPDIYAKLREGRFDAVIVNGWVAKTCVQALAACRLYGIPCIVRGEVNGVRHRPRWKKLGHRILLRGYAAFLAIGRNNRQYYLEAGIDKARIFDTPYCVDNEYFALAADRIRAVQSARRRFALRDDSRVYLFSGKLVPKKRPCDVVEGLRHAIQKGARNIEILVVGDGPLAAEVKEMARDLPVVFAGFVNQSEMPHAYAAADCLVLPSDSGETWGLVVNEAMASGLPALVSDQVGCAPDLIDEGSTGHVFRCGDSTAIADFMAHYCSRNDELARLGANARSLVRSRYTFANVVSGARAALEQVTGK